MSVTIREGSALDVLRTLPSESVQCVVTSPPYFGLRDYGTAQWDGGDPSHEHRGRDARVKSGGPGKQYTNVGSNAVFSGDCTCGAIRIDHQIGMESTPAAFIAALLDVFDEVKRVMRPDATLWVNLGDSYAGSGKGPPARDGSSIPAGIHSHAAGPTKVSGIPAKNLLLIPERFAIGMQERGWTVRSRIAWCKTSAMPESVRDRPTSAWEHIFMFSKSARYFYDADAVRSKVTPGTHGGGYLGPRGHLTGLSRNGTSQDGLGKMVRGETGANLRNFWLLGPEPLTDAHYAAFPTAIPKRCILAGTSEKGACPACGAPWVRVVERSDSPSPGKMGLGYANGLSASADLWPSGTPPQSGLRRDVWQRTKTTGWQPSCPCDAGSFISRPYDPVAQTVLDPFLGSGTTALVADRLGRDAIGIELSPTYARMARDRIANDAPMVSEPVEVVATDQLGLFGEVAG